MRRLALLVLVCVAVAACNPGIYKQRGGPNSDAGTPIAPEESLSALENLDPSTEGADIDVWWSKPAGTAANGTAVVHHDETPRRTTTCDTSTRVDALTLSQLQACGLDVKGWRGGNGTGNDVDCNTSSMCDFITPTESIPTLQSLLEYADSTSPKLKLNIDVKSGNRLDDVAYMVNLHGPGQANVLLASQSPSQISAIEQSHPQFVSNLQNPGRPPNWRTYIDERMAGSPDPNVITTSLNGTGAVPTSSDVAWAKDKYPGLRIAVSAVDTQAEADQFGAFVDFMFTNGPGD